MMREELADCTVVFGDHDRGGGHMLASALRARYKDRIPERAVS
jgi:hypothetical protein